MFITIVVLMGLLICAIAYISWLLKKMRFIAEELYTLVDLTSEYEAHLEEVYNKPTFYGDATLQELLSHTKHHAANCREFNAVFTPTASSADFEETKEGSV